MALTLKVLNATIFKRVPVQAALLPDSQKVGAIAGTTLELLSWVIEKDHIRFALARDSFKGFNTWYAFGGHIQVFNGNSLIYPDVRLKVPFFNQVDNKFEPMRTCNTSSCAMVARYLGAKISGDDEYYQVVRRYGDTTDHGAQTQALAAIKIHSTWNTNLDFEDLDKSLASGLPIVIGILHRGSLDNPTGGHMIVVTGKNNAGDYWVNDPFGTIADGYTSDVNKGNCAVYSSKMLERRWTTEGAFSGWGRLFYGN